MSEELVLCDVREDVAYLTLNNPARLNPMSLPMAEQVAEALDRIESSARVLVMRGSGKGFCSGADMSGGAVEFDSDCDPAATLFSHYNPLVQRVRQFRIPIITAVRGAAAGFGASLALAGDLVIASDTAFFVQAFRHIGLVPDGGSSFTLVKTIGRIRAIELMLLGERLPAEKAFEWGLVTRVVADEKLDEVVAELAQSLATGPTLALGSIRRMAWAAADSSFEDQLETEAANQRKCLVSDDHKEGVAAFLEKRPAQFVGL